MTKFSYSFRKILSGSDLSRRRLPLMVARSGREGPVVWLTACVHGDEVTGMVVVQEVFRRLRRRGISRGEIHAFPLLNPIGFEAGARNIVMSKEDLNRSFPGNPSGSLAERMADIVFTAIRDTGPSLVIDLHNDWMNSIPYALVDPTQSISHGPTCETALRMAGASGFIVIRDTELLRKSLSYCLLDHDIPSFTLELGGSFVVNEADVGYGVRSVMNILAELDMVTPEGEPFRHESFRALGPAQLHFSQEPVSSTSGIIRFSARPGDIVKKGRIVARIYNSFGKLQESVAARHEAIVLGYSDSSVAFPGASVMAFGTVRSHA